MESNQNPTEFCNNEKIYEISHKKINEKCENCQNMQFINTVITNWGDSLNDSSASDIIIFVKNDKYIWAHKLVLHIQCSNMLLDVTSNDTLLFTNIKEKISWIDVSYNIALAFLEFIYCGIIEKYSNILDDLNNYPFLKDLAKKYKVKELFVFLEKRQIKIKNQMDSKEQDYIFKKKDNLKLTNDEILNLINEIKDHKFNDDKKLNKKCLEKNIIDKSEFEIELKNDKCTDELSQKIVNCLNDTNTIHNSNISPDLFDDTTQIKKTRYVNKIIDVEKTKNNENFSIFDSVNQLLSNTINSSTSENIGIFKNTKENINLLQNIQCFSTPNNMNCNIQKLKSNLSLFIEQIQRENADLNVDSEDSVLSTNYKICRNPFNIRQNDSSEYCISQINTITEKKYKAKKDILIDISDYDKNSKVDIKVHEKNDANMSFNHELIDNMTSESNIEKYKNNSLNENINNVCNLENEKIYFISKDSLKIHQENMKSLENLENLENSENNTFSDFDTSENEISMYSKYKEKHENNNIVKYRNFIKESILKNNIKNNVICVYEEKNNIDNDIHQSNINKNSEFKLNQENNVDLQAIEKNSSIESNINKYNSIESSILISSSSELDDEDLNINTYEKNKKNKNIPCTENSKDNSQVFENDIYLANVYIDNNDDNIDTSLFAKEINQLGKK